MSTFIVAIFFLLITPGPGVLSTAGVGSAFGYRAGVRYIIGLFLGTNLVALAVVTGLAGIMLSIPGLRQILLIISALYLLYLAMKIALSGSKIAFIQASSAPGILHGIALQTINPKAYAVNTTLFTGFAFMPTNLVMETILKFLIINAFWIPIHLLWLAFGVSIKRLALKQNTQRIVNWVMALLLIGVVALAAISASVTGQVS